MSPEEKIRQASAAHRRALAEQRIVFEEDNICYVDFGRMHPDIAQLFDVEDPSIEEVFWSDIDDVWENTPDGWDELENVR